MRGGVIGMEDDGSEKGIGSIGSRYTFTYPPRPSSAPTHILGENYAQYRVTRPVQ